MGDSRCGVKIVHHPEPVELVGEAIAKGAVSFNPRAEVFFGGEAVPLIGVAFAMGNYEVVPQIHRIKGPGHKVIDGHLFCHLLAAVKAEISLKIAQGSLNRQKGRAPRAKEELVEIRRLPNHRKILLANPLCPGGLDQLSNQLMKAAKAECNP